MHRMALPALLAGVVLGGALADSTHAADVTSTSASALATTEEVPAALQALSVNHARIVTTAQAQQVRGEGGKGNAYGRYKHRGYGVHSGINFGIIGGQTVEVNIINSKNVRIGSHSRVVKK